MDHKEKAVAYYKQKFNCAQGIFAAYAVEHGVEEALALRLGTNFGGGAEGRAVRRGVRRADGARAAVRTQ